MSTIDDLGSNLGEAVMVTLAPEAPDAPAAPAAPPKSHNGLSGKRAKIILEENETIAPTGQMIGFNGMMFLLQPGVETDVPVELCHVLDLAIESRAIIGPDTRVVGYRNALRFPYRRVHGS